MKQARIDKALSQLDADAANDYAVLRTNGVSEADALAAVSDAGYVVGLPELPAALVARLRPGDEHGPVLADDIRELERLRPRTNSVSDDSNWSIWDLPPEALETKLKKGGYDEELLGSLKWRIGEAKSGQDELEISLETNALTDVKVDDRILGFRVSSHYEFTDDTPGGRIVLTPDVENQELVPLKQELTRLITEKSALEFAIDQPEITPRVQQAAFIYAAELGLETAGGQLVKMKFSNDSDPTYSVGPVDSKGRVEWPIGDRAKIKVPVPGADSPARVSYSAFSWEPSTSKFFVGLKLPRFTTPFGSVSPRLEAGLNPIEPVLRMVEPARIAAARRDVSLAAWDQVAGMQARIDALSQTINHYQSRLPQVIVNYYMLPKQ